MAAVVCMAFVAHMLFIPYAHSPLDFGEALQRFSRIPWMELGSDQNVALVSRGLMFLPVGFLLAVWIAPRPDTRAAPAVTIVATLLGCLFAVSVNFAQQWFPARTVSLNNLFAESVGVFLGAFLWAFLGDKALRWWRVLSSGGTISLDAALAAYTLLYLLASLTPFDFVTSAAEFSEKLSSDSYALWRIPGDCGPAPCSLKFLAVFLASLPCGWWFAARIDRGAPGITRMIALALGLSIAIEILHLFLVSGVTQGASVVVRTAGLVAGALVHGARDRLHAVDVDRFVRPLATASILPYLLVLAYIAGWFRSDGYLGIADALPRVNDIVWMPFYFQYFEGYQSTMRSVMVHAVLYAPVGAACWLWARHRDRVPLAAAMLVAGGLAFVVESSKLFIAQRKPDYTDVLIAAVAAAVVLAILRSVSRGALNKTGARMAGVGNPVEVSTHGDAIDRPIGEGGAIDRGRATRENGSNGEERSIGGTLGGTLALRLAGGGALAAAILLVAGFPVWQWGLALALLAYALLLVRVPIAYLVAVPVLLPILDLAPISGRFYWDEFDAVLATTVGVRLLMPIPARSYRVPLPRAVPWILLASVGVSAVIGIWPPAAIDANAFSNYLSPYNALRIAKGYFWAGLVLWLALRDTEAGRPAVPALLAGLALALGTAVAGVFAERFAFAGAFGWHVPFRAAGLVSANHIGGAYLEVVLVVLAPFALAAAVSAKSWLWRVPGYGLVFAGAVALLLTLSRAASVAWLLAVSTFFAVWWLRRGTRGVERRSRGVPWQFGVIVSGILAVAVAVPQFTSLLERIEQAQADMPVRLRHWSAAIALMPGDVTSWLFGLGLGSFPRHYYFAHANDEKLPAYRFERSSGTPATWLLLTGGSGMYLDQRVDAHSGGALVLTGRVRSENADSTLHVSLCAKSFLHSFECNGAGARATRDWTSFEVGLKSPAVDRARPSLSAPLSLSVQNGAFGSRIAVTDLSLRDGNRELLRNGSFATGADHWLMTSDSHLVWKAKNTPLQIFLEQGIAGVLAWIVVIGAAARLLRAPSSVPVVVPAFCGAFMGILAVGLFDTVLDSPRVVLLFALIAGSAFIGRAPPTLRPPAA